jgi:hypothetical protein
MLGGKDAYDLIGARPAGDFINLDMYVRELGKADLELVFLAPGSDTEYVDLRTAHQKKEDDAAFQAREREREDGGRSWDVTHAGIDIATSDPKRLVAYIKAAAKRWPGEHPNIALAVRDAIVVHAKTDVAAEYFQRIYADATDEHVGITNYSPGPGGGGYFVFTVPDGVTLPAGDHVIRFDEGGGRAVEVFWSGRCVPIPPSVVRSRNPRFGGEYRWIGEVREAPKELLEALRYRFDPAWPVPAPHSLPDLRVRPIRPLYPVPPTTAQLREAFGIIGRAGEYDDLKEYVLDLGKAGLELVFLESGTKDRPSDLRLVQQKIEDDAYAREREMRAGNPRYALTKTRAGIEIATADPERLASYIDRYRSIHTDGSDPNLAMLVRNLLVVDTDWAEGVELFIDAYRRETGQTIAPTVLTPGVLNPDGTWKHYGGGHFYFLLPEGWTPPDGTPKGISVGEGREQYSIFLASRYILIPPSVRPEGPYQWVGEVLEAPDQLLAALEITAAKVRAIRAEKAARAANRTGPDNVDRWAERTEWRDLLEPDGWCFTGCLTSCGCPEVTAPGVHASPKSATAHEIGCQESTVDTSAGHGPLHVWTDNPPSGVAAWLDSTMTKRLTKLQYVAAARHGGDCGAAIRALGIGGGHRLGLRDAAHRDHLLQVAAEAQASIEAAAAAGAPQ